MKLTFLGATHEVTGSCFFLEACNKKIVIDCGMEQGPNAFENEEIPVAAGEIDFALLTHAHIDHSGMLPLLAKNGFKGEIHATIATADLCNVMLRDSAHIQEFEAEWRNRKGARAGREPFEPVYTMEDAMASIECFVGHPYDEKITVCEGIQIRFIDVGHLLGSSSIEVWVTEDGVTKKIVFSGDIGNTNQPILCNPEYIKDADYVVMESTYGDRNHGPRPDYIAELSTIIQTTFDRGGNVVIPAFAVGRTQEMLYFIREIKQKNLVKNHPGFKVYVDSPLAIEATNIFNKNQRDFDEDTKALIAQGINPINFEGLCVSVSAEESKMINFDTTPKVIISASGMCDAGRIKHHLKHNLWRKDSTVLFVGYQAVGSLGRSIVDGAESVKLFGEPIEIRADIKRLAGVSGHADKDGLLTWLKAFEQKPTRVFVVHGEDEVCTQFTQTISDMGYTATAPYSGTCFDLKTDTCLVEKGAVPIRKDYATKRAEGMFLRLLTSGKRLLQVIENNKGGTNKDLARFSSQIESLCDKWDR